MQQVNMSNVPKTNKPAPLELRQRYSSEEGLFDLTVPRGTFSCNKEVKLE